jgi:hypothetical protein
MQESSDNVDMSKRGRGRERWCLAGNSQEEREIKTKESFLKKRSGVWEGRAQPLSGLIGLYWVLDELSLLPMPSTPFPAHGAGATLLLWLSCHFPDSIDQTGHPLTCFPCTFRDFRCHTVGSIEWILIYFHQPLFLLLRAWDNPVFFAVTK